MSDEIKKAIIPVAGLGTRFLPLSRVLPKEFFPLVDKPVIQYIVEEAKNSGISEIIFVVNPTQKMIFNYYKRDPVIRNILIKRKKEDLLKKLNDFEAILENMSFNFIVQKKPLGDGNAILQAAKFVGDKPVAVLFADDVVDGTKPAISQLMDIYKTCNCPVAALKKMPEEKLSAYGVPFVEKIANRLYKIKKLIEKPEISKAPSDMVVVGKYILTPDVFDYLKKATSSKGGEIILAEVFDKMLTDGKIIYGYEIKGDWLECGDTEKWLKSFLYLSLKDPKYGSELRSYLKQI